MWVLSLAMRLATALFCFLFVMGCVTEHPHKTTETPLPMNSFVSKSRIHVLRLKPHQDLRLALQDYTRTNHLRAGFIITAVGSLESANLRLADQKNPTHFSGKFEIVSLVGTLSPDGPHLHISLSDETGKTIGGHLVEGCPIYTTAEIVIGEAEDLQFSRPLDAQTGFNELQIQQRK